MLIKTGMFIRINIVHHKYGYTCHELCSGVQRNKIGWFFVVKSHEMLGCGHLSGDCTAIPECDWKGRI